MKNYGRGLVWASTLLFLLVLVYYDLITHEIKPPLSGYWYIAIGAILAGETKTGDFVMAFIKENADLILKKRD